MANMLEMLESQIKILIKYHKYLDESQIKILLTNITIITYRVTVQHAIQILISQLIEFVKRAFSCKSRNLVLWIF